MYRMSPAGKIVNNETHHSSEEIGYVDMEFDIALLRQLIDVLEANGANPPPPTWEPAPDPWPAD